MRNINTKCSPCRKWTPEHDLRRRDAKNIKDRVDKQWKMDLINSIPYLIVLLMLLVLL